MAKTNPKTVARMKRIKRIRKNLTGTADKPRLRVFRSIKHIYAQIIDDSKGHTLVAMSSKDAAVSDSEAKTKSEQAQKVGNLLAAKAKTAGISKVIFDRGGNLYHGRVKALSDGAREGGLDF
jgi:large subunit ribosomal protein L18